MMVKTIGVLAAVIFAATITIANALGDHNQKCNVSEGNGFKVDSCDANKFLSCQSSRCLCYDVTNQMYDYVLIPKSTSRSKRGIKKKIAAGVAGGVVGYGVGRAVSNNGGSNSNQKSEKTFLKVYSCYGRVGSRCLLDYNNVITIGTTTSVPNTNTTNGTSFNTTIVAPTVVDITKIPKCVRNAQCVRVGKSSSLKNGVVQTNDDPRLGICACAEGYKASATDQCIKTKTGAANVFQPSLSIPLLSLSILYLQYFATCIVTQ